MAVEYPDIMNDYVDARRRFESGSVHYLAEVPLRPIPAGQLAQLALTLQNVMDVPSSIAIHLELPKPKGKLKRLPQPLFQVFQPDIRLTLENGEVAQLILPLLIQPHVPPGDYELTLGVRSESTQEGLRVRPEQSENLMPDLEIRYPQGLGITPITSWGFETQRADSQTIPFRVEEAGAKAESVDLQPRFSSVWTPESWDWVVQARREVNDRRIHIVPELTAEALYKPFLKSCQVWFGDSSVGLHIGEGVFVAKVLTYTVLSMTRNDGLQDGLLVPIYAYAQAGGHDTDDVVWLITELGCTHILEVAIALSFSLVEKILRQELWDRVEQRAVRSFIIECLEEGSELPVEFLYLPLVLGGLAIADKVMFPGEGIQQSIQLLEKAKAERAESFADPDLAELNRAFGRLEARLLRPKADR